MAFSPVDVELVKESSDIVSVIQRYVVLKRSGSSWKGKCPFHNDNNPSFYVSPARGTWKCFSCNAGGDVISFLMRHRNLSFVEVIEELAEENGITLHKTGMNHSPRKITSGLFEAVSETQEFFLKSFKDSSGSKARDYLRQRAIDDDVLKIGIGYAPGRNALLAHLRGKGYSDSVMGEAGLIVTSKEQPYDRFRDRLTFPIKDRRGRVVSFGARAMGDGSPKYLNGPETPIYRKGSFLYGYCTAQQGARDTKMAILVEGYFDHARLISIGLSGTVATSGTALTEKQARNLKSMSDNIYICYDGDAAGCKAAVKASRIILSQGGYPGLVRLPDGMDPDDFVRSRGEDAFRHLIDSAMDPVSFCISLLGGEMPEGSRRILVAKKLLEVVSSASNPLVEEDLQRKVENFTGFSRTALARSEEEIKESRRPSVHRNTGRTAPIGSGDRNILRAVTAGGLLDRELIRFLKDEDMRSESAIRILEAFRKQIDFGYSEVVFGELEEDIAGDCVDIVGILDSVTSADIEYLKSSIERKRREIPRRKELRGRLASADPEHRAMILEDLTDSGALHEH